jgi:hypothetical protein
MKKIFVFIFAINLLLPLSIKAKTNLNIECIDYKNFNKNIEEASISELASILVSMISEDISTVLTPQNIESIEKKYALNDCFDIADIVFHKKHFTTIVVNCPLILEEIGGINTLKEESIKCFKKLN